MKQQSMRLRLASMKPDVKTAFASPRQSLANGYDRIKRGASSLRQAISPSTTPGVTPRSEGGFQTGNEGMHSIASNAIKEADNPACLDVEEAKSQAVAATLHTTGLADKNDKEKQGKDEAEAELLQRDQPNPKQLRAVWLLMKVNAASSPQQTMRWLHDLEWLLVSLDPLERHQPVSTLSLLLCRRNPYRIRYRPSLPASVDRTCGAARCCVICLSGSTGCMKSTNLFVLVSLVCPFWRYGAVFLRRSVSQTRSTLVEAKAIEMCLKNFTTSPDDLQLCVSSLAILVHLSLAKEASARLMQLGVSPTP